ADGHGGGGGTPFSLHAGSAAAAYYAVAAGAATCAIWAASLPSPQRPEPHHHHHHQQQQQQNEDVAVDGGRQSAPTQRVKPKRAAAGDNSGGGGGGSPDEVLSSPSFATVLDLSGLEPPTGTYADAYADALESLAAAAEGSAAWGTSSTTSPDGVTDSPIVSLPAAVLPAASGAGLATQARLMGTKSRTSLSATLVCDGDCSSSSSSGGIGGGGGGGSVSGTDGGFGSALSTSPTAWDETGSGSMDQSYIQGGEEPGFSAATTADVATAAPAAFSSNGCGCTKAAAPRNTASDILSAAAAQIKLLQGQCEQHQRYGAEGASMTSPGGWWRRDMAAAEGGEGAGEVGVSGERLASAASATPPPPLSPTAALFRRYLHELRMGWPVLLPVVLLLFANISTQASIGAWVTTYCQRAAGLDEATSHAVTAAYWAAFTGTRMAAVAAAPFLHASRVLLVTTPFAVAGAGLAVAGLPKISWLFPHGPATAEATAAAVAAAAAAGGGGGGGALAVYLPLWALYTAVCLVGVGISTGFANTISLTGDHLQLDGFTNGILSSVAGLASTLCPAAVPWLAAHTQLGYGALMAVALAMSGVQLAMVVGALIGARWVDEWQRLEAEEEERGEGQARWRRKAVRKKRGGAEDSSSSGEAGVMVVLVVGEGQEGKMQGGPPTG
ncbi:hypothetical protein VaNZ11_001317, partial [Volvox africanus]